jgi:hypothetical protein
MNDEQEISDVEVMSTSLVPMPVRPEQVALFGSTEPKAIIVRATEIATHLRAVITKQGLVSRIQGKEYPRVEAWTLLGTLLGVFPVLQWTKEIAGGYEARVEARTLSGAIVGAAEAICLREEGNWADRPAFALKSMAQTRASAKALRIPLGFVMSLSGFEATPAEEMGEETPQRAKPAPKKPEAPRPPPRPPKDTAEKRAELYLNKCKLRWIEASKESPMPSWVWWGYAVGQGWLLATEPMESMLGNRLINPFGIDFSEAGSASNVQKSKEAFERHLKNISVMFAAMDEAQRVETCAAYNNAISGGGSPHTGVGSPDGGTPTSTAPVAPSASPGVGLGTPSPKPAPAAAVPTTKEKHWWQEVICPIPPKGTKKKDYVPITLGEMQRVDGDRAYGFIMNWERQGKGNTDAKGKFWPPTELDLAFAAACKAAFEHLQEEKENDDEEGLTTEAGDNIPW